MPQWPVKQRELHNHHMDSTVWNDFVFRDDDIVIATYAKSGTTWLQQIVFNLVFPVPGDLKIHGISPWLDSRRQPKHARLNAMAAQPHRRMAKTHLPVDALVYSPHAKYLYIARDGRDVVWKLYNHHTSANELYYSGLNDAPGLVGPPFPRPPGSIVQYFREWLDGDGYPFWSFWENIGSWWAIRSLPNLMLLHYENLKQDLPGEMRRIAAFIDVPVDEARFPEQMEHSTFAWMKAHAAEAAPLGGVMWDGGAETFINKGTNGRWRDTLPAEDSGRYEAMARERLGEACARWLATGEGA